MPVAWTKIARPFVGHFAVNLVKTILGSALIGYGMAQLYSCNDNQEEDAPISTNTNTTRNKKKSSIKTNTLSSSLFPTLSPFLQRYITSAMYVGVGLYFVLPSLASQMLWESAIPAFTATEVAQDLATDNIFGYIKSWRPETTKNWPLLGGTVGGNRDGGNVSVKTLVSTSSGSGSSSKTMS